MEELWLIIAVTVGLLAVIAIALSTRKKRTFRDGGFTPLAGALLVLGIIFGSTDQRFFRSQQIFLKLSLGFACVLRFTRHETFPVQLRQNG